MAKEAILISEIDERGLSGRRPNLLFSLELLVFGTYLHDEVIARGGAQRGNVAHRRARVRFAAALLVEDLDLNVEKRDKISPA